MKLMQMLIWGIALLVTSVPAAFALEFTRLQNHPLNCVIRATGQINRGDAQKFEAVLRGLQLPAHYYYPLDEKLPRLCLDSQGGSLDEAIKIADIIAGVKNRDAPTLSLGTAVEEGARCESACAVVFIAGGRWVFGRELRYFPDRILHVNGRLGVHQTSLSIPNDSYTKESVEQAFASAILSIQKLHIRELVYNFPPQLLRSLVSTPPNEMAYVETFGEAFAWDIDLTGVPKPKAYNGRHLSQACMHSIGWYNADNWMLGRDSFHFSSLPNGSYQRWLEDSGWATGGGRGFGDFVQKEKETGGFPEENGPYGIQYGVREEGGDCSISFEGNGSEPGQLESYNHGELPHWTVFPPGMEFRSVGLSSQDWLKPDQLLSASSFSGNGLCYSTSKSRTNPMPSSNRFLECHVSAEVLVSSDLNRNVYRLRVTDASGRVILNKDDLPSQKCVTLDRGQDSTREDLSVDCCFESGGDSLLCFSQDPKTLAGRGLEAYSGGVADPFGNHTRYPSSCVPTGESMTVVNVNEYVNIRSEVGFDERILGTASLNENVRFAPEEKAIVIRSGVPTTNQCAAVCRQVGKRAAENQLADDLATCFDHNMIWYRVRSSSGVEGYVSGRFLSF